MKNAVLNVQMSRRPSYLKFTKNCEMSLNMNNARNSEWEGVSIYQKAWMTDSDRSFTLVNLRLLEKGHKYFIYVFNYKECSGGGGGAQIYMQGISYIQILNHSCREAM